MTGTLHVEVPIPDTLSRADDDRELLSALRQALAARKSEPGGAWETLARRLEAEGWQVEWSLTWTAEARRGPQHEQAVGATRDDAFAQLYQLTMLDTVEGCP